nr:uncharacterized protein LOC128687571 isoform X3 [Cherax quadricarinatus]XP_053631037.1 uncharacterized protein LOC128687571 isoform X3 [Cherax quadricarinatus]
MISTDVAALLMLALTTAAAPVNVIHGDLCRQMDGRKFYLEAGTKAFVGASNVSLPAFPRIATRTLSSSHPTYHRPVRSHSRREGPQQVGARKPRYSHNITSLLISALTNHLLPHSHEKSFHTLEEPPHTRQPPPPTTAAPPPVTPSSVKVTPVHPLQLLDHQDDDKETSTDETTSLNQEPQTGQTTSQNQELETGQATSLSQEPEAEIITSLSQAFRCGAEFFTCPDCHLEFTFQKVNLPSCSHDDSCRCDYLRVREPPYVGGAGGLDVCSTGDHTPKTFATQTREVILDFLYTRSYQDTFVVSITAKRNKYQIRGKLNVTQGYIKTPFFPELYPKEHWMEYQLKAEEPNARIKVNFQDFQLSPWSFVEIQDTNRSRVAVFNGNVFRPPILVSSGPTITVRFSGNGETARGFNLLYTFVDAESVAAEPAITDCGGFVTNFGGTITMMNMAKDDTNYTIYDCVWIVQPPQNYAFKSHLSIKVVQFDDMVSGTRLEVRRGVTSEDYLLEELQGEKGATSGQEYLAAVDTGFYVRLKGAFTKDSKLAIVYTSFSYLGSCYTLTDLMCHNHRCIPKMLRCDGFDHCGDSSDEPPTCYIGPGNKNLTPEDAAWWYQHTPNYYFPQKTNLLLGGPHGWSSLLVLVALIALVMTAFGLISYMFKSGLHDHRTLQRERRALVTHRDGSPRSPSDGVEEIDASADDPPLYEPPPDYEEVIKVILSGNNLKLVRRPGGITAWVPDKLATEGGTQEGQQPLRTRHASLDLEQGMEVVLWNPNTLNTEHGWSETEGREEPRATVTTQASLGHVRRSSLPVTPLPEMLEAEVQGHSVSLAPETIKEAPDGIDSPRPPPSRPLDITSPQLSEKSFNDTSVVSTPGPSTPQSLRVTLHTRKSKRLVRKGGKKKKSTISRKNELQDKKEDDSAPPSYEMAMQQVNQGEALSSRPADLPSTTDAASQVNESTQTNINSELMQDLSPMERLRAAKEMFQRISRAEELDKISVANKPAVRRPAAPASKTKHNRTLLAGSSITRGTVKARKAMLLKAQKLRPDCDCNGACSCAHFKQENSKDENFIPGGVKSKVHYFLTIEKSTKKRETNISVGKTSVDSKLESDNTLQKYSSERNSSLKKRQLIRNQSAPSLGHIRQTDLDIYFSQNETIASSSVKELEQPLITPVNGSLRPTISAANCLMDGEDSSEEKVIPSIRKRVQLYNELSRTPSCSSSISRQCSPSPSRSHINVLRENLVKRHDSEESLEDVPSLMCIRSINNSACEAVQPGFVKEATVKFVTAFNQEIRSRLQLKDSEDWNEGSDSPPPINIPYLNLKNEEANTPDIGDIETLSLPPLKQEEAESLELWASSSQGKPDLQDETENASEGELPSQVSGAVPKRTAVIAVNNSKDSGLMNSRGQIIVIKKENRAKQRSIQEKKHFKKLDLTNVCMSSDDEEEMNEDPGQCWRENKSDDQIKRLFSEEDLVVINLNSSTTSPIYSEDDSQPPSLQQSGNWQPGDQQVSGEHNLSETLNETINSDSCAGKENSGEGKPCQRHSIDLLAVAECTMVTESTLLPELKPQRKIPIPSPRGSKIASITSTTTGNEPSVRHRTSESHLVFPSATEPAEEITPPFQSPSLAPTVPSIVSSLPEHTVDSSMYTSTHSPLPTMLSPQLIRSGIIKIQTGPTNLTWNYI